MSKSEHFWKKQILSPIYIEVVCTYDASAASDEKHGFLKFWTLDYENGVRWSSGTTLDDLWPPPHAWIWRKIKIPCTRVHDILFFLQIQVPGYITFCLFFKSMYPGTWNFDFFFKSMYPGAWNLNFFHYSHVNLMGGARLFIYFYFWHFFSTCEKIT